MRVLILTLILLSGHAQAEGEWITEFGGGYKIEATSSALFHKDCTQAYMRELGNRGWSSCGGDNPVFVGWPIMYRTTKNWGYWQVGWFHQSHWFDGSGFVDWGGDAYELHFDCVCATIGFNWSRLNRRSKR
jgi:hypothetical protein